MSKESNLLPTLGHEEEVVLISKKGIVRLLGLTAFREFQKTPRRKARIGLNLLFSKAKERGYQDKEGFLRAFRAIRENRSDESAAVKKIDALALVETT